MFKRPKIYRAIGLMSGTAYDGIDIGFVKTDGAERVEILNAKTIAYPKALREDIERLLNADYSNIWKVESSISDLHSIVAHDFIRTIGSVDIIGFHGQTIMHDPEHRISVQIGNPHVLAVSLKTDVVYDFRRKDIALGGQGAPLVPVFLKAIRPYKDEPVCFLNIGGVANVCYITNTEMIAFDTGPGNAPLNDICQKLLKKDYDDKGRIASEGIVNQRALELMLNSRYFTKRWPKSLDRNQFDFTLLANMNVQDSLATMVEFIASTIRIAIDMLPRKPREIIVSGGGVHNAFLLDRISQVAEIKVVSSSKYGLPSDHLEAYAFAYLAVRSKLGMPISFPTTTGVPLESTGGVIASLR